MVATITGGSGNYDILVDNGAIRADAYTGSAPYTYTWETADGTGTFVMTVTDKADSTKTATAQFAVTSAPIVITHDIAIYPSSADTAKTSAITHDGDTQTISLKVGETYTGITQRVATDGSALSGTGLGCTFTPASSDTVASYTLTGQDVVITAKAVGTVDYNLTSGDGNGHKKIHVVVTAAPAVWDGPGYLDAAPTAVQTVDDDVVTMAIDNSGHVAITRTGPEELSMTIPAGQQKSLGFFCQAPDGTALTDTTWRTAKTTDKGKWISTDTSVVNLGQAVPSHNNYPVTYAAGTADVWIEYPSPVAGKPNHIAVLHVTVT